MDLFAYSEKEMLIVLGVALKRDKKLFTQFFEIIVRSRTEGGIILKENFGLHSSLLSIIGEHKISYWPVPEKGPNFRPAYLHCLFAPAGMVYSQPHLPNCSRPILHNCISKALAFVFSDLQHKITKYSKLCQGFTFIVIHK